MKDHGILFKIFRKKQNNFGKLKDLSIFAAPKIWGEFFRDCKICGRVIFAKFLQNLFFLGW